MVETEEVDLDKTVVCNLETSHKKNEKVRECVEEWQDITKFYANRFVSFEEWKWGNHTNDGSGVFYKPIKEGRWSDTILYTTDAQEAYAKVSEAFSSWKSNGKTGENPKGRFGDGNYIRVKGDNIQIVKNDRGYGIKWKYRPYYDDLWFHVNGGSYQYEILKKIVNDGSDVSHGTAEFHLEESGRLNLHLTYSEPVEIYKKEACTTAVGVDIGERAVYAVTAVNGSVLGQEIQPGQDFRRRREELSEKKDKAQRKKQKYKIGDYRRRYTEQMANVYASRILDFAVEHEPCVLCLEDLTDARKNIKDPIHDWPYDLIQEKIVLESKERRIPVEFVEAYNTSKTCRKCGSTETERDGHYLKCFDCGYNPHSDFNAAVNIAEKFLS